MGCSCLIVYFVCRLLVLLPGGFHRQETQKLTIRHNMPSILVRLLKIYSSFLDVLNETLNAYLPVFYDLLASDSYHWQVYFWLIRFAAESPLVRFGL